MKADKYQSKKFLVTTAIAAVGLTMAGHTASANDQQNTSDNTDVKTNTDNTSQDETANQTKQDEGQSQQSGTVTQGQLKSTNQGEDTQQEATKSDNQESQNAANQSQQATSQADNQQVAAVSQTNTDTKQDATSADAVSTATSQSRQANQSTATDSRTSTLEKYQNTHQTGYIYSPDLSSANGGWNWLEDGRPVTGFRQYAGSYYWFVDGVRQNQGWRTAWNLNYYTDQDGRAVQGQYDVNGQSLDFGNDNTFYLRSTGYLNDGSDQNGGYRWYENGQLYSGFRYYTGTYYWFVNGVRQNAGWRSAWGLNYYTDENGRAVQGVQSIANQVYYFGDDNTYYARPATGYLYDGSDNNGGYRWYDNGSLYTGFRYYTGTYYWFVNGVRQNAGWRDAWNLTYYTDENGRAVQGSQYIDGQWYFFGNDGTYYRRFDKNQVINWFYNHLNQLTYSMTGSRTGADGTADCSGAMTEALMEAGATKADYIYSTDTIHDYLKANGYTLVAENAPIKKEVGDIIVWGQQGYSAGAAGHIMVISQADNDNRQGAREISVDYSTGGLAGTAVTEHDYNAYDVHNDYPYTYVYRHN